MKATRSADGRDGPGAASGRAELLGAVALRGPDGSTVPVTRPQVQVLLALLVLEGRPVTRGEIAEALWGDRPLASHWQGAVRGVVSKVRDLVTAADLDAAVSSSGDGTVHLVIGAGCEVDVLQAERAVDAAEQALADGAPASARDLVAPWLDALQQPFLPAGDGDWVRSQQHRVTEVARRAVRIRIEALRAGGRPDLASEAAAAWIHRNPIDEGVHEQLIAALLEDGRRGEAVEAYRRLAELLADELGVGPSDAIASLVGGVRPHVAPSVPPISGAAPAEGAGSPFLGRRHEMDALTAAWRATVTGASPRLVVIHGKSGIGKTRLADELSAVAAREGAQVRWARCFPGAGVPFEPLLSAVHAPLETTSGPDDANPTGPALARADALRAIAVGMQTAAERPAVLVLDDLQWASDDVTAALEQTVAGLRGPLLIVATGRNLPGPVHEVLARIQRSLPTTQIRLRGLDPADLEPLFDQDGDRAAEQADALHRRTGGHPFFVTELVISPRRTGMTVDPGSVPEAVRSWIGHRADALAKPVRSRLDLAAVIGEELALATLARCAHIDVEEALDQVELLVDDGFLVETDRIDVFAFPHLITRDAIYERIGPSRRARLHLAVAEALGASGPAPGRHAELAHHLTLAGPDHALDAGAALLLAGREALDSGAWSLAESHYGEAAQIAPDDPAIRAGALTGLARAAHLQRRRAEAEDLVNQVLAITRAHRLPLEFAEAVLVLVGRAGRGATQRLDDLEQAALLREALDGIAALDARDPIDRSGGGDAATRTARVRRDTLTCHLEGELAQALTLSAPAAERSALARHAVSLARGLDPPDTHLTARALLIDRLSRLDPSQLGDRIGDIDQVLAIAPSGRSVDTTLAALAYRHEDLLLCGRRSESRRSLDDAVDLADRSEHPYWRWATAAWRGLDALIDGDLVRAEELAFAAAGLGGDEPGVAACLGVNLVDIRLYQGRSAEVLDLLAGAAEASPNIPCYRAVLALCAAEAGDTELADRSYRHFRDAAFATIPEDSNRLLTLVVLADTAGQLGDAASAEVLHDLLLPAADLQAILNCYGGGGAYWGPVAHQLGRLAALAGRPGDAEGWFARAERSARDLGARAALDRISADPLRGALR
ncbi:ATP-binding protein [Aquihabitans daechungensis]|uniref:ATP-binding protein n=1 Tax=Aquihabitans daechungensis TaxID=1052257 RepID=UPI003B9EFED6